ncbi:acetone carboxylase subunit gamma [candidate division CSSED10-310 bacterium]|uniref:Acetone carboxylase subunit gamma n=1 Tax=candidate division CSSED10-310 bacterium TaxID=2855610 RepID=A0ABV6YSR9_UNCC1
MKRVIVTEYLEIDLDTEEWCCRCCQHKLISVHKNYKEGCLVYARDPSSLYPPHVPAERYSFAPDKSICYFVEFYCPGCGTLIETECLPPGHPPTHDLELDLNNLRTRCSDGTE